MIELRNRRPTNRVMVLEFLRAAAAALQDGIEATTGVTFRRQMA
jgi:hypothetical protein